MNVRNARLSLLAVALSLGAANAAFAAPPQNAVGLPSF